MPYNCEKCGAEISDTQYNSFQHMCPPCYRKFVLGINETTFPNAPLKSSNERLIARGPALDLTLWLLIFVVFAVMDVIFFLKTITFIMALPLIVHAVFLPFLFTIAYKQRRGLLPPRAILTFIQVIISYMVVYVISEIVVAFVIGNLIMIGIYIFIGVLLVLVWSRVRQQLKNIFEKKELEKKE